MVDYIQDNEDGDVVRGKLNTLIDEHNLQTGVESSNITLYVETTGDDVTGDGSVGLPFATILRALQELNTHVNIIVTIQIGAGAFDYDWDCANEFARLKLVLNSRIYINGVTPTVVESGLTLTAQTNKEWTYDVIGATFTADEHDEHWLFDGNKYTPIIENGVDTIGSFLGCDGVGKSIYSLGTTVNFTDETFGFGADVTGGQVRMRYIILDFGTDAMKTTYASVYTILKECMVKADQMDVGYNYPEVNTLLNNVYLIAATTGAAFKSYFFNQIIHGLAIRCVNGAILGFNFVQGITHIDQLIVKNTDFAISVQNGCLVFGNNVDAYSHITVIDSQYAYSVQNNAQIHQVDHLLYIDNVDYVVGHRDQDPNYAMLVIISDLRGTPNVGNLTTHLNSLSPPNYNANIVIT